MKKLSVILLFCLLQVESHAQQSSSVNSNVMIRHTVIFTLKYPKGSSEEKQFFDAAAKLSQIPQVQNFESLKILTKNDFDYCLSMEFATSKAYDEYVKHIEHAKFIENYWKKCVEKFLEIDYEPNSNP